MNKHAVEYVIGELDLHHWTDYKVQKRFGHVYINFKSAESVTNFLDWINLGGDPRDSLGFFIKKISPTKLELISYESDILKAYSKKIDDSIIKLDADNYDKVFKFASQLNGFKKIKQTKKGSKFVFDSIDTLFLGLGPLKTFIQRIIGVDDVDMFVGNTTIIFHLHIDDDRPDTRPQVEEL